MTISMSDPSPLSMSSVSSSSSMFSWAMSWSRSCWMRGSSGPSAFLSPAPSASRSRKYRSKSRSKVGRSRDSLTSVAASADLKVSRCSRPISDDAASASMASLGEMRNSARRRSPMNSRIRWSIKFWGGAPPAAPPPDPPTRPRSALPRRACPECWASSRKGAPPAAPPPAPPTRPRGVWTSSREGDPRGFEHVLALLPRDGTEAPILEAEEAVEGAGGDEVSHLELPAELARRRLLVALHQLCHIRRVAHEMEHAHRPFRAPQPQHDLVGRILARGLHRHFAGLEEMRDRLGHGRPEEGLRPRMRVVEVPPPGRVDPELGVLAQGGGDAAAALDEHGPARPQLRQPDARTRKPQLAELAQGHGR